MFQPQSYLSFGQLKYNLKNNEMIILQSLLNSDFFENLIPMEMNKYAKYNTFDSTEPNIHQNYTNEVILDELIEPSQKRDCFPAVPKKISHSKWGRCFPSNYKEIEYKGSKYCGNFFIMDIIKQYTLLNPYYLSFNKCV